jgi:putative SOS response-associated peptidase YedK
MKIGSSLINARAETVRSKPAFRDAYQKRRCLVPVDGFYEWKKAGAIRIPHHIRMADEAPLPLPVCGNRGAIRFARRTPNLSALLRSITGEPNELVATIHNRMPVIIPRDRYGTWLSAKTSAEERSALLVPYFRKSDESGSHFLTGE